MRRTTSRRLVSSPRGMVVADALAAGYSAAGANNYKGVGPFTMAALELGR